MWLGLQISTISRLAAYDSASINGCGLIAENVGRPWPAERIAIAAPSRQFVADY